MRFIEAAFGALKGEFGSGSSAAYVTKLRNKVVSLNCRDGQIGNDGHNI